MTEYALGGGRRLEIGQADITRATTTAIANAANSMLMGGGGVDGAIHRAAGPELLDALRKIKKSLRGGLLETGQAVLTPGFRLQAKYVIHCVGPIYEREGEQAPELLRSCYSNAIRLCCENDIRSVTFPSISTGVYGYPLGEAAPVALQAIAEASTSRGSPELYRMALFGTDAETAYLSAAERLFGSTRV